MENNQNQDDIILQMKEIISLQEQELNMLKELNDRIQMENDLLKKFNQEILDTVHGMINSP